MYIYSRAYMCMHGFSYYLLLDARSRDSSRLQTRRVISRVPSKDQEVELLSIFELRARFGVSLETLYQAEENMYICL